MNIQMTGAQRPKLSLHFAGSARPPARSAKGATLSGHELRRIVSEMLG